MLWFTRSELGTENGMGIGWHKYGGSNEAVTSFRQQVLAGSQVPTLHNNRS